jgi:hypothetical protein
MGAGATATMVLLCAIWALGQIAVKVGVTGISPLWQAGLRSLGAAIVLAGWMSLRGIALRTARSMVPWSLAIGTVFALEFVCLYIGLSLTTAARGSVLLYTAPFFVALGGHRLLADPLTRPRVAGLVLAFEGVVVALSVWHRVRLRAAGRGADTLAAGRRRADRWWHLAGQPPLSTRPRRFRCSRAAASAARSGTGSTARSSGCATVTARCAARHTGRRSEPT